MPINGFWDGHGHDTTPFYGKPSSARDKKGRKNGKSLRYNVVFLVFTKGGGSHLSSCYGMKLFILYIEAFGETWMQFNVEGTFDMGLINVVRTRSSYSQLCGSCTLIRTF